ncbi:MAG: ABC-ATPase domain-containing protein [Lachnospiraceae bacterium]|nr:ABC-ATPase domain-containing protein [Lachnospiraceae bacterium]
MKNAEDLRALLDKIDRRGYPAYKDTKGTYAFGKYVLGIDHVQGDPFAAPSKVSIHVSGKTAGFPAALYNERHRRIALQDYLLRQFGRRIDDYSFKARGSGKSGLMGVSRPGQEILERSACRIEEKTGDICVRMEVGFPANGRTVNAGELKKILFGFLPECVEKSLLYASLPAGKLSENADLADDQQYIREKLAEQDLVVFVANGAVLPRESGVSDRPMKGAVVFSSPKTLEVTLKLPHRGELKGMGIRKGITMIAGGGYHGKSTLLEAIERGVYNHIAGDGREYVITQDTAMKIRAEDGRSVKNVDISMFIRDLPNGKDTKSFYSEDASGSTSQAAGVVEAMEAGAGLLLIDEDTSATNFMIRDELMQRVVNRSKEPIIPFIDRVRELYEKEGVSTVLVAGSSGSYFFKADCIIQMDNYCPVDITEFAKKEAEAFRVEAGEAPSYERPAFARCPMSDKAVWDNDRLKIKTMGLDGILINKETIDMRYVEQLVDAEQLGALGYLLKYAELHLFDGRRTIREAVAMLSKLIAEKGIEAVCGGTYLPIHLAVPRAQEIYACFNRYRGLRL